MRFLSFLLILICLSCQKTEIIPNEYNVIPQVVQLEEKKGRFYLNEDVKVYFEAKELSTVADFLKSTFKIKASDERPEKDGIILLIDPSISNKEGYKLAISPYELILSAKNDLGAFYGIQTLRQLLSDDAKPSFPCVEINDYPRFQHRGMHLDVARHFFPVDFIKKYIDLLAYHKMNRFHWHLTEDQGWRIEIKQYPKLTSVGAFRKETLIGHYNDQPQKFDGKIYGGFYTQEEVKEIVKYAEERFITIIPEIEMPGHSLAALTAYPELACTDGPFEVATKWGIFDDVYCPTDATFTFLENVLSEVAELFPGEYIHIGGDECPKLKWKESKFCQQLMRKEKLKDEYELQSYFIKRIATFLNKKGKKIIGWDEILEGGLAPSATVMSWRGTKGGIAAAKAGHNVIMSPMSHCYFDYYQSIKNEEPLAIGGFLPLEKVYSYEPIPDELNEEEAKFVLGAQGNVWTEYMPTTDQVEYMAFPRACALAEVVWSAKDSRDYDSFLERLPVHLQRLKKMNVNAANHIFDLDIQVKSSENKLAAFLKTNLKNTKIHYTLDGSTPVETSSVFKDYIAIDSSLTIRAQSFKEGKKVGKEVKEFIQKHKLTGKKIVSMTTPSEKYSSGGKTAIMNGVKGNNKRYGDREWLGFYGEDVEFIVDLSESTNLSQLTMRFFNGPGQWIYLPKKIKASISDDNINYKTIGVDDSISGENVLVENLLPLKKANGRFLKLEIESFGIIPDGAQGARHEAWLFIDEIVVE